MDVSSRSHIHTAFLKRSSAMPLPLPCPLLLSLLSWCSKPATSFKVTVPDRCRLLDFWPAHAHTSVWFFCFTVRISLFSLVWRTLIPTPVPTSSVVLGGS